MRSDRAKVLHQLDGRPLINHVCETALKLSPGSICVVVGHQAEQVKSEVLAENDAEIVHFVVQKAQLGTGDAVNAARPLFENHDSTLLVLSGDVPSIRAETLKELVSLHLGYHGRGAACTVLTVKLHDPFGYGRVMRDEVGEFARIVEHKDATEQERLVNEINSGIYCFDTKKLYSALTEVKSDNAQGEFYLTDVPRILKAQGDDVAIYQCPDHHEVEGVNDRRQLADMEANLRSITIERMMLEAGVSFVDPESAYIGGQVEIGRDTVVYPNVTIEGNSVIGKRCIIRPGTRIVNSTVADDVEIRDNCLIMDSAVGAGCTVGPMAHLRGHATMEERSKVGNFVELKKTVLGKGSKASHLTYLGDATIGRDTNIGAGTITCNYDGKNKHATKIGDNVKIGSDTMLIAPITVGDGAVTGAGSVVTKDVEARKLVAGVPARTVRDLPPEVADGD
jgi:bifunctional UDP-N-acetylglucosamine pyrophosphorylase/glucosamine-1-phosphate N-acetyltransferase